MTKEVLVKALITLMLLINITGNMKAGEVLFETNFQTAEGWIAQGSTAGADKNTYTQDIVYNEKTFQFKFVQGQIFPEADANGEYCSPGYLNLNKNNNKTGVGAVGSANFELPVFDKDVSISFYYSSSSKADRQWCVEYSLDDGETWTFNEDDLAPMKTHGSGSTTCNYFFAPTKILAGQKVRLTVHSTGGVIRLYSLKVEEYVPDNTPPTIVSTFPEDEAVDISPSMREITINFSERVKGGASSFFLLSAGGSAALEFSSGQLEYHDDVAIFALPSDFRLALNETYYLVFEAGSIRDLANNEMPETTIVFNTKVVGSSEKEITSFKIKNQVGEEVINSSAGTVNVIANHDVDLLSNLSPLIEVSPFASFVDEYKDFSLGSANYIVTAEDGTTKNWTVTITNNELVQATLPVIYKGSPETTWQQITAPGWSKYIPNADRKTNIGNDIVYYVGDINNVQDKSTSKPIFIQNWFTAGANRISFMLRYGNITSNYKIAVQESDNGVDWTYVATFQPSNLLFAEDETTVLSPTVEIPDPAPTIPSASAGNMMGMRSYPLKTTSQYVRMLFEVRTNSSFYFDDFVIENVNDIVSPALSGVQPAKYENNESGTIGQIVLQFSEAVKPSLDLIARTTSIKINGEDFFEDNILCQRDGSLVLSNLEGLVHGETYNIEIPADALVDLSDNPFSGKTLQFVAELEDVTKISNSNIQKGAVYTQNGNIYILGESPVLQVNLYNSLGVLVKSVSNVNQLSVGDLKGIYIVSYKTVEGVIKTTKILL